MTEQTVEAEFKEHGCVAIYRLAPGAGAASIAGKDYHPKAGDNITVRSKGGFQWPVVVIKDHRGAPVFKFGTKAQLRPQTSNLGGANAPRLSPPTEAFQPLWAVCLAFRALRAALLSLT